MRIVHLKLFADMENCLGWNGDLHNPNDSDEDCEADNESGLELDNCTRDS